MDYSESARVQRSAAIDAAGAQPDDDPHRTKDGDDAMEAVVGSVVFLYQHNHSVSHGDGSSRSIAGGDG